MGKPLLCWLNVPPKDRRPTPLWDISKAYSVATRLRPPTDLGRRRPRTFLADCHFRVRVVAVTKDAHGVPRAREASYSRVKYLIERVEGTPPCLQDSHDSARTSASSPSQLKSESQSESQSQSQSGSHNRRTAKTKTSGSGAPALGANRARTNECAHAQVGEAARDEPAPASSHSSSPQAGKESTPPLEQLERWLLEQLSKAPSVDQPALQRAYRRDFGAGANLDHLDAALTRLNVTERSNRRGIVRYSMRVGPDAR
jgi:hypothetical protein